MLYPNLSISSIVLASAYTLIISSVPDGLTKAFPSSTLATRVSISCYKLIGSVNLDSSQITLNLVLSDTTALNILEGFSR